jgi:hypothetical protein
VLARRGSLLIAGSRRLGCHPRLVPLILPHTDAWCATGNCTLGSAIDRSGAHARKMDGTGSDDERPDPELFGAPGTSPTMMRRELD